VRLLLAPGASGSVDSLAGAVAGLRRRGVEAEAIAVPQGRVEKAAQCFQELARPEDVVAGQSYGGRAASLAAAESRYAACVMFSFPLSGKPEERPRTGRAFPFRHWCSTASATRSARSLRSGGSCRCFPKAG